MREEDIRPEALARRYYELSAQDADRCFPAGQERLAIPCVGCGSEDAGPALEKNGFAYSRCGDCGTLYQSPRPSIGAFEAFYRDSESSNYWSDVFFPAVAEVRREKIFRPRVERLAAICEAQGQPVESIVDVGAGFGIFLDEWRKRYPAARCIAVEPSAHLAAECRAKGFEVVEEIAENVVGYDGVADLVACFEVLEHVYQPLDFLRTLTSLARPGGFVFVSTLGVDGFDIQTLWEKSNAIFPPHHINFLSVAGFERLFARAGLADVAVTTPGQLDVDIVRNAAAKDPTILDGQRFLSELLADDGRAAAFQRFLADNRLSSHCWVIGRRPENWGN
ncbi:MAG: class I SAM-dependent methyltransferase [Sphingomonas sp.]|uniref:class I SAM-dependent methyltransferase n=1 Tax=Sphingomonas sp. TaxID=28214 RepID=UPI0025DC7A36|nr:class I SAM-dependent methyltransferase [Sphingomonas sp.]MBQ1497299.1 class I SAM-dependent methyltransferase [Sphingomonas sp.]